VSNCNKKLGLHRTIHLQDGSELINHSNTLPQQNLQNETSAIKQNSRLKTNLQDESMKIKFICMQEVDWRREVFGLLLLKDGSRLMSTFIDHKASGMGLYKHSDGSIYYGYFIDDKAEGFGFYNNKSANYYGDWADNTQNGIGKILF
jgi:hypothetical protein